MKEQSKTYEAQVLPETREDRTQQVLLIMGGVLLFISILLLLSRSGKGAVGITDVMAQLEG